MVVTPWVWGTGVVARGGPAKDRGMERPEGGQPQRPTARLQKQPEKT